MSKLKNRVFFVEDALVHYTRRGKPRSNYFVIQCNARIVHNATDEALVLTCMRCMSKEREHLREKEDDEYIGCAWCSRRIRFRDSYSPGDIDPICKDCNKQVPRT
jgi:hypothetical protein